MERVTRLIRFYVELLIIQYFNKPNARDTIEALVNANIANGILFDIRDGFNLDTAVGVQLDIIGQWVGVNRTFRGQDFSGRNFFAFTEYDETTIPPIKRGFSTHATFDTDDGEILQYSDVVSSTLRLNDDDFRLLIRLKIIQNNSSHSLQDIDESLFRFFEATVRADDQGNMVMNYFVPRDRALIIQVAIQKGVMPRPVGVRLNYIIEEESRFFGFATYQGQSSLIKGFTTYATFDTDEGESLNYSKLTGA